MKTRLISIIVFFTITITIPFNLCKGQISDSTIFPWTYYIANQNSDSTSNPGDGDPSDDIVLEDVWLCDELQGGVPYDIIYINDIIDGNEVHKIFVYTERKLIGIDEDSKNITSNIELSLYGSTSHFKVSNYYSFLIRSREKHLAYNHAKHELYCLTQDFKIKIIDPYFETIIGEISPQLYSNYLLWAILKYNPVSEQIFLSCTYPAPSGQIQSKLISYSASDYNEDYVLTFNELSDYAFNPEHDILYLTNSNDVELREASSGNHITTYSMSHAMGIIINAHQSSNLNKIYCLPKDDSSPPWNALAFNGNSSIAQYISLGESFFTCGTYDLDEDRVYVGYSTINGNQSGVISFDPDNPTNQQDSELGFDLILDIKSSGDKVFAGSRNSIYVFKNGTHFPAYDLTSRSSYFFRMAASSHFGDYIFVTDLTSQSIEYCYSPEPLQTFDWEEPIVCGGVAYHGLCDEINQKLYLFNGHELGNHLLYIYDIPVGNIERVEIGRAPTCLAFDSENNIVYIACNADYIKRLNASNNSWLPEIIFPAGFEMCSEIFYKEDGKLFCSVSNSQQDYKPAILVYDLDVSLTNPEIIPENIAFNSSSYGFDTHFDHDEDNDRVFISMRDHLNGQGLVIAIFSNYSYLTIPSMGLADEIRFDESSNKLFVKHRHDIPIVMTDWISVLDFNVQPPSIDTFTPRPGVNVSDIELDQNSNLLYITYNDPSGEVDIFSTEMELIYTATISNRTGTIKYNPINKLMYVHVPFNYSYENEEQLWSIEPVAYSTAYISLGQNNGFWYNPGFYLIDLIHDKSSNTFYTSNGHGNIKAIQCHADRIHLSDDWSWVSFPRLERDPSQNTSVPAESVLNERIKPGPDTVYTGTMQHFTFNDVLQQEEMIEIKKLINSQPWDPGTGELDFVSSNKGYQISTRNPQEYIELYGDIQDPSVPVELLVNFENWAGYFLTYPQHPVHAIPVEIRDNLTWMAGQYWYCFNENPYPDGSGGLWRCACSQGDVAVKYGDMVKLYSNVTDDFTWQQNNPAGSGIDKQPSEMFSYEEQANYEAYILELDTNYLPDEIGAMIEDSCIGASQVLPGEDTVLLCAYTEGFEGEEVSFQFAYNTKSAKPEIQEYLVLNTKTGIKEKRRIKAGEKEPYYFISFRKDTDKILHEYEAKLRCYPNPATNEVIVYYFIPTESVVSFQLINIVGTEISSWSRENQSPGDYQLNLNTTRIPSGYYFIRMITNQQMITGKICIVH